MDPLWGRMVTVRAVLMRVPENHKRTWVRNALTEPTEALVTGWRTLADGQVWGSGRTNYWGEYEPREFVPERHFKAYVVVLSDRSGPTYVLPSDVCPCTPESPPHTHFEGGYEL